MVAHVGSSKAELTLTYFPEMPRITSDGKVLFCVNVTCGCNHLLASGYFLCYYFLINSGREMVFVLAAFFYYFDAFCQIPVTYLSP